VPERIPLATIGFTRTTAENFFDRLRQAQIRKIIDVRLHNTSQLSGFAKADDLAYFSKSDFGDWLFAHATPRANGRDAQGLQEAKR
jgi:uncharacterized protein (DUF488 family)